MVRNYRYDIKSFQTDGTWAHRKPTEKEVLQRMCMDAWQRCGVNLSVAVRGLKTMLEYRANV